MRSVAHPSSLAALVLTCVISSLFASLASAQSVGVRAGVSGEPDQFYFGGHFETPPVADRLHFRPNVEIGVGNDVTLVALNFELAYKFATSKPWGVYAGGGPALNIISTEGEDSAEGGFNIMIGVEHRDGFFGEFKIGVLDSPDLKLCIGYVFRK